jgi:hypothetical protein
MVRVWTQKEKDFLRDNYDKFPTEEVARRLGRTRAAINIKATRWKIKKPSHYWTDEDKLKLQKFYPIVNTREELSKGVYRELSYGGKTAEKFLELIYRDATLFMSRKYNKYNDYLINKGM